MEKIVLPEIGDGISSGVVISIQKEANEKIEEGDILAEIETDKAAFPVNSHLSGVIKKVLIKEGQEVGVGDVLAEIEISSTLQKEPTPTLEKVEAVRPKKDKDSLVQKKVENLPLARPVKPVIRENVPSSAPHQEIVKDKFKVHAGPATRKLARELGVDLSLVTGTERGSRIGIEDLKKFVKERMSGKSVPADPAGTGGSHKELPDFTAFGKVEVKKASHLRSTIANHIQHSYFSIPHVHQFDEVDLASISRYQREFKDDFKNKGSTLSVTVFIIKALSIALNKFPVFNSSYDHKRNTIHYKKYFNIGVAVDTSSGLIVPVIKNVDQLNFFDIGRRLMELAKETRDRKVKLEDLRGASMTLSNLGGIGGTYFNPIINWPEVAILGVGRSFTKPIYENGEWSSKQILPIVLAYDHRVIDGADGARFISYLKSVLEKPEKFLIGLEYENK